jgi:hypothetical protein
MDRQPVTRAERFGRRSGDRRRPVVASIVNHRHPKWSGVILGKDGRKRARQDLGLVTRRDDCDDRSLGRNSRP